ncbi:MAG TPA: hypothetical protein VFE36_07900, partial [Candidatus Baltobacteraceae bacterium]|nr:hypothetical protein [Candidatus Baltobacteraceae bacterium]
TDYQWYLQFFNDATIEVVTSTTFYLSEGNLFHPAWVESDLFQAYAFVRGDHAHFWALVSVTALPGLPYDGTCDNVTGIGVE